MRKKIIAIILSSILLFSNIRCQKSENETDNRLLESSGQVYTYTRVNKFRKTDLPGERMDYVYLSVPSTNEYQEILNYYPHGGEIFEGSSSKEKYVRYTITEEMNTESGEWFELLFEFDYIPKSTEYITHEIGNIYAYDTTSGIYQMYTSNYFDYIVTENDYIKQTSDQIWNNSTNICDYARKCLDHVDKNFSYIVSTEFYTLEYILNQGGGDCGNLATILINLLRCKKIPSRYVSTIGHTWAEFYMEGYGWVPVDPTFNIFGKAPSGYSDRIIWSNSIKYNLKGYGTSFYVAGLAQIYHLSIPYPHTAYDCDGSESKKIKSEISYKNDVIDNKLNLKIYPNPTQNTLYIEYPGSLQKEAYYTIIDLNGKTVQQGKVNCNSIEVSKFTKGLYFLNLEIEGEHINNKIQID